MCIFLSSVFLFKRGDGISSKSQNQKHELMKALLSDSSVLPDFHGHETTVGLAADLQIKLRGLTHGQKTDPFQPQSRSAQVNLSHPEIFNCYPVDLFEIFMTFLVTQTGFTSVLLVRQRFILFLILCTK